MTATRVFIIVLVLIAMAFAITLAWAHRAGASPPSAKDLVEVWKPTFQNLGRMNPEDVSCPQRKNSTITFPPGSPQVVATIKRISNDRVRRLNLVVSGSASVNVNFVPNPGDKRATTNQLNLHAGTTNTLAIFAPGGTLTFVRNPPAAPTTIEIR
jgi:hypothetical protein